jgi:hypothetical protein
MRHNLSHSPWTRRALVGVAACLFAPTRIAAQTPSCEEITQLPDGRSAGRWLFRAYPRNWCPNQEGWCPFYVDGTGERCNGSTEGVLGAGIYNEEVLAIGLPPLGGDCGPQGQAWLDRCPEECEPKS